MPFFIACDSSYEEVLLEELTPENSYEERKEQNSLSVQGFVQEFQNKDLNLISRFESIATLALKMNENGSQDPAAVFIGTEEITDYFTSLFNLFSTIRMEAIQLSPSNSGQTIFLQFEGRFYCRKIGVHLIEMFTSAE